MDICKICGTRIAQADPILLYHSMHYDTDVYACEKCEKQIDVIMESQNSADVKKAINYFYTYIDETNDKEVKDYLYDLVRNNASAVNELKDKEVKMKPVSERQKDFFAEHDSNDDNGSGISPNAWIAGLKLFAWIQFIAIIVIGFLLASSFSRDDGRIFFWIVAVSIVVAFATVAGTMVFLNIAKDIRTIRKTLQKKK